MEKAVELLRQRLRAPARVRPQPGRAWPPSTCCSATPSRPRTSPTSAISVAKRVRSERVNTRIRTTTHTAVRDFGERSPRSSASPTGSPSTCPESGGIAPSGPAPRARPRPTVRTARLGSPMPGHPDGRRGRSSSRTRPRDGRPRLVCQVPHTVACPCRGRAAPSPVPPSHATRVYGRSRLPGAVHPHVTRATPSSRGRNTERHRRKPG